MQLSRSTFIAKAINVNISGLKLDEFYYYYYVTFRTTSRTSLFGDDFISN